MTIHRKTWRQVAALREFADLGLTKSRAAQCLNMAQNSVVRLCQRFGVSMPAGEPYWEPLRAAARPRADQMAALYRSGKTLAEIGAMYGVTRERVRQLIGSHHGLTREDGGSAVRTANKAADRRTRRNALYLTRYSCGLDDLKAIRQEHGSRPTYAFQQQRRNAHERGIGWELTFWQWWCIWRDSGRWKQRGRGQGYVMCRKGDEGPYAVGNVFIATAIENISSAKHKRSGLPTGVSRNPSGTFSAQRRFGKQLTYLGTFRTPELASAAYLMAGEARAAA